MIETFATNYFARHRNEPAILFGNGPSLNQIKGHEKDICDHFVTIGMNRSWMLIDARYHCIMFHHEHLTDLQKGKYSVANKTLWTYKDYTEMWVRDINEGLVVYVPSVANPQNPMHKFNIAGMISSDLSDCSYADMTGQFALEVALWMRCSPIYLIGYDLYGGHFCDKNAPLDDWQEVQVDIFEFTAEQVTREFDQIKVYNCNPESKIEGFEKITLEEALEQEV